MSINDKLDQLEATARPLQLDAAARASRTDAVRAYVENWLTELPDKPVFMEDRGKRQAGTLTIEDDAIDIDQALAILAEQVDSTGQNTGSSRFFAYIPSGGLYTGALGDFLAAGVNRYAGVDYAGPGAARLENALLRWLSKEVGYPPGAQGDLASGGSIATLSAIAAARQRHDIRARDIENTVVYLTQLTHHCVTKALQVAGLAECRTRQIGLDAAYRMDSRALEEAIAADRAAGLNPWLIVGTAGTTDLGTVDPLPELATIAAKHGLWFHVDAAYGGSFVLCDSGRQRLAGIERSDSVVINPHKGMFLPAGLGIVLVRDGAALYEAFHARGSYMQDMEGMGVDQAHSACDFSPELTRPFRGLRLWLSLKLFGLAPFRAALEEKLLLAEYFYERIRAIDGFVTGPPPDLSIVAFRYKPARGDANDFNRRLFEAIRDDGRIFLSTTTLDGAFTLRMAILGYQTHRNEIDTALEVIEEFARRLDS
ncbi:MAG: aminotransferase class V-fold PLP-dependent enzyme [Gammaproteobacteria bacterium]|nr:aminotransferase class V-fold PLP-dependent enzyme [Gammaproteobacteria bacterium]